MDAISWLIALSLTTGIFFWFLLGFIALVFVPARIAKPNRRLVRLLCRNAAFTIGGLFAAGWSVVLGAEACGTASRLPDAYLGYYILLLVQSAFITAIVTGHNRDFLDVCYKMAWARKGAPLPLLDESQWWWWTRRETWDVLMIILVFLIPIVLIETARYVVPRVAAHGHVEAGPEGGQLRNRGHIAISTNQSARAKRTNVRTFEISR